MPERFVMERFEARLEVDNREAVADSSLTSCIVSHTAERFVDNILAGSKASNRFPDVVAAVDRSNRMDLVDMLDSAFDAWAENSRAGEAVHIDMVPLVPDRHLLLRSFNDSMSEAFEWNERDEITRMEKKKDEKCEHNMSTRIAG